MTSPGYLFILSLPLSPNCQSDAKVLHFDQSFVCVKYRMPTKNPRINITLEESTLHFLTNLAAHEHKSISSLTKELVLEALDRREDKMLSAIAERRDIQKTKRVKHHEAWK